MAEKTFEQINQHLFFRLGKDRIFIGKEFSYFKLFQHGIVYDFLHTKGKILKTYFRYPLWVQNIFWRKGVKASIPQNFKLKENVWLEPGRTYRDSENNFHSMYGKKLLFSMKNSCTCISLNNNPELNADFSIDQFGTPTAPLDNIELDVLKDINLVAGRLRRSVHYSKQEQAYILSSLHVFYHTFRKFYSILKNHNVKRLFLIAHYHNEGIIAACKKLNIECIELQHGLINKKDLYYVYHDVFADVFENGLMPDKIFLYGPYWERVLKNGSEWKEGMVQVAGNYLAHDFAVADKTKKENLILVAAQKGMEDKYIPYIESLRNTLKKHPEWKAIVKLHPLEKNAAKYDSICDHSIEIAPLKSSIFEYLERCKIQISIYSTTFFDSAGYDVVNFCWATKGYGSDYARSLVEENLVIPIMPGEDVIEKFNGLATPSEHYLNVNDFYAVYNPKVWEQPN